MPKAMVEEVSPRSMTFRNYNKIPLILTQTEAALQIGLDLMAFKFSQTLAETGYFNEHYILITVLFLLGCILALSNLQFINLGVKYYDAVDVVPVLNAATLIAEILAGLIVGGEYTDYNGFTLFLIFVSSVICIAGIQVLVMKSS